MSQKKHPHRKPILGLTPSDIVQQMTQEAKRGKVRNRRVQPGGPPKDAVLPATRSEGSGVSGGGGIFTATPGDDDQRPDENRHAAIPDAEGRGSTQLSKVLKRMLGERVPPELLAQAGVENVDVTNAEALGAIIFKAALDGKQWAVELIRDQTEGKPTRAAQVDNSDGEVEEMLDRVGKNQLNQLVKGK